MRKYLFIEGGITPYPRHEDGVTPSASRLAYATHRLLHRLRMLCAGREAEPRAAVARGQRHRQCAKRLLLTSMLILSACGFEPMQGQAYREKRTVDLSAVSVNVVGSSLNVVTTTISRRYAQLLKAEIEDNVNPKNTQTPKQFMMDIAFAESDIALFVNPDGTASRGDLNYTTTYSIKRVADGVAVASGSIRRISSYNSSPTADFASYVSIEDARKRGMMELAQDYKLRLASLLPTLNTSNATAIEAKPGAPALELQPVRNYETIRSGN